MSELKPIESRHLRPIRRWPSQAEFVRPLIFTLAMDTGSFAPLLLTLFGELVQGSSDPSGRTYVLNQGDGGLLAALDGLSATAASGTHGRSSIAAHVDHLRYGLSL